jgi:hypothetical protein
MVLTALIVVIVLFAVLSGGNDDSGSSSTQTQATGAAGKAGATAGGSLAVQFAVITVRNGKPVGGVKRLEYKKGDRVRFEVRSDVSDEIHVHGYDLMKDVKAGGTVRFNFEASLEGVFEAELESRGEQIAELRVKPS